MATKTDQVWIPGKAFEIVTAAPFMTARGISEEEAETRKALKSGEKRNKGRGYRVLVTLNSQAAIFLCDWFRDFQISPAYKALGTAEALAVRTITDRICDFAGSCKDAKEKRSQVAKDRAARMRAGKERKAQEAAVEAREAAAVELARLEAELPKVYKRYEAADKATDKARTKDQIAAAFRPVMQLQNTLLNMEARRRMLRDTLAA